MKEKNRWIEYYKRTCDMFRENAKYSWEMIKFYTILCSSIITIIFGFLGAMLSSEIFNIQPLIIQIVILGFSIIFPLMLLWIIKLGRNNFSRECRNMYEQLAILIKIERKLGLHTASRGDDERIIFKNDDYYWPERWKDDWLLDSEKSFVDRMISLTRKSYYSNSIKIFTMFNYISIASILFILCLIIMKLYFNLPFMDP